MFVALVGVNTHFQIIVGNRLGVDGREIRVLPPHSPEMPMPVYHFNVNDGVKFHDKNGTDFSDLQDARGAAIQYCGELLKENAHKIDFGAFWCMEVTDTVGLVLLRLDFNVTSSPAGDRLAHGR